MHQDDTRENNVGILRLLFAALVIVSHSPELIDGNRSREITTRIFGTRSLGEIAVDGFFLISGYLITRSFIRRDSLRSFLTRRVLRILPGFLACFWICVLVIAPLAGAASPTRSPSSLVTQLLRSLVLLPPEVSGTFKGLLYPTLNSSMWTIAYEFACYAGTIGLCVAGLLHRRVRLAVLALAVVLLALDALHVADGVITGHTFPIYALKFAAIYTAGSVYYLFRDRIPLTSWGAAIAAAALVALLFDDRLADAALATCGGYLIFWFAFAVPVLRVSRLANRTDLSYGIYLYAWPFQNLILWNHRGIAPWLLSATSLVAASLAAYVSWIAIEGPALRLAHARPLVAPAAHP